MSAPDITSTTAVSAAIARCDLILERAAHFLNICRLCVQEQDSRLFLPALEALLDETERLKKARDYLKMHTDKK